MNFILYSNGRIASPYGLNLTSSRYDEAPTTELIDDLIARRYLSYFVQSWLYHRERCLIWLERTEIQHGYSQIKGKAAAHWCLLPNLGDNWRSIHPNKPLIMEGEPYLISKKSKFYHEMNSTILVDVEVNYYDCELEHKIRPIAVEWLNRCAHDTHPYSALKILHRAMHKYYETKNTHPLTPHYKKASILPRFADVRKYMEKKREIIRRPWQGNKVDRYNIPNVVFKRTSLPKHANSARAPIPHQKNIPRQPLHKRVRVIVRSR